MESHLLACASCARFHETLDRGVSLIYRSGEILVPPGFKNRIIKRIDNSRSNAGPVTPAPAGFAAALMVAAAIALVVFQPRAVPEVIVAASQPAVQVQIPHFDPRVIPAPYANFTEFGFRRPVDVKPLPLLGPENDVSGETDADQPDEQH